MLVTTVTIAVLLVLAALAHLVIAFYFRTRVVLHVLKPRIKDETGLASVILSVRGCDPGLKNSLIQLLNQQYENYEVQLIVDHRRDNAWEIVHEVQEQFDDQRRLTIHEMKKPLKTCGLKCSALLQGLDNIHPNSKYLVLIDADVTPHANWLSELLAPLQDRRIGVVTGNQWFEPKDGNIGSLLRSLWNAGALVPTAIYSNPWAGSFAMRMEDVRRARLQKVWRKSIVDDGPIRSALRPLGLSIYFSPLLIMVNRERCTLPYVHKYVARMLTWSRMYESTFVNTVIHCLITVGLIAASFIVLVLSLLLGATDAVLIVIVGLAMSCLLNACAYLVVRNAVAASAGMRGEELPGISLARAAKLLLLMPAAYLIYGFSCLKACLCQQIQWRQITYDLRDKSKVKMVRYRRWMPSEPDAQHSEVSL
jgi:glycosyltransferase involved in cell wall biosynthesis